jgi:F-type H+-transporting ATPase subunit gamma
VYFESRKINNVLLVVITSDRGLCGGFNSNVAKLANNLVKEKYAGKNITVLPIGKKGGEFFAKTNVNMDYTFRDTFLNLSGEAGFEIGTFLLDSFKNKKIDAIEIVYNQFKNAATLILTNESFLPINLNNFGVKAKNGKKNDYIFEPSDVEILEELIPRILKTQLYRALLDSFASEHGARMVAMDKATENAGDLLKSLKVEYNRARQAAITTEISEIVSGAAAQSAG